MPYSDRTLTCRSCGSSFVFTSGEQTFYSSRGLQNEPGRCPSCRDARRSGPAQSDSYVRYGAFASFGGRTPRQMHPATCERCNQLTEVPFRPRGERPVYCSECFALVREEETVQVRRVAGA